ncbi:MAG: hypothetical protein RBT41_10345 [Clostridia bacterium]|jgi:hypothetical protein|nr:hypothetical protein [Clostridia bacterium]
MESKRGKGRRYRRNFWEDRQGAILQVFIGLIVMGALSYGFWHNWESKMTEAGASLKNRIETDSWLSE